ncbi:septum formation protein Maf [Phototrophicus methaneseepsis]|uniref:dTTP/UTP pyrophosphatase n=1 Tax=Phototrophicus methaneseepsis TaxID=2710758 RepID=A0A7S8E8T9_9CHLR|nr:Maf family protein [Phototrophicus methaneseepsis]QPC82510.1 septum formation protein Maf [Phototrophicus methaneseepsis]
MTPSSEQPQFILASSSPRRRELLASLGIHYTIIKPDIDETQHADETPLAYVKRLSQEKARAVAEKLSDEATILAADTIVILAADTIGIEETGELLGKPLDADDARATLKRLRGRDHLVITAFSLLKTGPDAASYTEAVQTKVTMRDYSDEAIEAYIASGDPFDKAGSYAIQNEAFHPVDHIDGSMTNVIGLPLDEVKQALIEMGIL